MAVVRSRSAPPYALVTFIALWVITTILAVLFYLQWNKADAQMADQTRDYERVVSGNEASTIGKTIYDQAPDKSASYLAVANSQLQKLKNVVVGDPRAPFANVMASAEAAQKLAGPNAPPLVAALGGVASARDMLANQLKSTQDQLAAANASLKSQIEDTRAQSESMEAKVADLSKILDTANASVAQAKQETVAANEAAQKAISEATDKAEEQHRSDILALQGRDTEITTLQAAIKDLQARIPNRTASPYVGVADGTIVKVDPGAGEAYINLNQPRDRMTAGMTFTVYDPRTGVRFGTDDEAMGKGSIEVIEPGTVNSLVRITRTTKGMTITNGDLIANQVYQLNKNRKFHYVVYGDFDLDGDGVATAHERERLESLIVSWGGVIDPDVTSQTDYVVMGTRPKSPLNVADDAGTVGSAASQRGQVQDRYDALIAAATRLSIPVLNANRFLSMIGYYGTTIVRH